MRHNDRSKPPVTAEPQFDEFPDELRALKQWVMWRYVWKDEQKAWAKVPMQPDGTAASSTDPATWSTFDSAVLAFNQRVGYFSGIGFVFTRESGYVGIDIDNAVEWTEIDGVKCPVFGDWIKRTIAKIGETYVEYSPSRTGVHLIVKANPKQAVKFTEGGFEIYAEGRYFTMTGDAIENAPIADATEAIDEIVEALLGTRSQRQRQRRRRRTFLFRTSALRNDWTSPVITRATAPRSRSCLMATSAIIRTERTKAEAKLIWPCAVIWRSTLKAIPRC